MAKTCRSRPYLLLRCPGLQKCFQNRWLRCRYLGRGSPKSLRKPVLRGHSTVSAVARALSLQARSVGCASVSSSVNYSGPVRVASKRQGELASRSLQPEASVPLCQLPPAVGGESQILRAGRRRRQPRGGGRGGAGAEEGAGSGRGKGRGRAGEGCSLGGAGNRLQLPPLPTRVPPFSSS